MVFKPVAKEELVFQEDIQNKPNTQQEPLSTVETHAPIQQPKTNSLPEIVSIKQQSAENNSLENHQDDSQELKIIDDDKPKVNIRKEKQENLNKTIELVQNAINSIDIASDETFDIDIPDTYSNTHKTEDTDLKEFDEDFDVDLDKEDLNSNSTQNYEQNNIVFKQGYKSSDAEFIIPDNKDKTENIQDNTNVSKIGSIFSNENPFDNPPEAQNIIAAKQYPETKQALNLDFKTFLSNYNAKSIIDEFLICAYYIKHISGQHSFNMKYINSKIFQATGNIADSSVINGLITGNFIKVIEVDGQKKYSISSTGEEYFMTHYQR